MRHRVGGHDRMRPRWTCTLITIAAERPRLQRSRNAAVYRSGLRLDDGIAEIRSVPRESTWINSLPDAGQSKDARRKCHPLTSHYFWHELDHSAIQFPRPSTLCWSSSNNGRGRRKHGNQNPGQAPVLRPTWTGAIPCRPVKWLPECIPPSSPLM